ncbi:hypothetical protein WJX74_007438 [Apatococcus lobatus]|uniref:Uncharacterized protein n=1 Tax=Apatococcus lobatus TaxID=904363 RepID=A0AAW1RFH1_9CHLO
MAEDRQDKEAGRQEHLTAFSNAASEDAGLQRTGLLLVTIFSYAGMLHATSGRDGFQPTLGDGGDGSLPDSNDDSADYIQLVVQLPSGATITKSNPWDMPHSSMVKAVQSLDEL